MSVYAVLYSNGVLKVGHTGNVPSRMRDHHRYAKRRALDVVSIRVWEKDPDRCSEGHLKMFARHFGGERYQGTREYFTGVDLEAFYAAVDELRMGPITHGMGAPFAVPVRASLPLALRRHFC